MDKNFYTHLGVVIAYALQESKTPIDNQVMEGLQTAFEVAENKGETTMEEAGAATVGMMKAIAEATPNNVDDIFAERLGNIEQIIRKGGYTKNGFLDYAKAIKQVIKLIKELKKE